MNVARKSVLLLVVIAGLVCLASAPLRADDSTNQVKSATDTARDEARQKRAMLPLAKGTLLDLDLLRHQLKLQTQDGVRTFTYTARTYVFRDKEKIGPEKLKVGEVIAVRFNTDKDGNVTLTRVKVHTSMPSAVEQPSPTPSASTNQLPNTLQ
jgi:hypothetical protein